MRYTTEIIIVAIVAAATYYALQSIWGALQTLSFLLDVAVR